LVSSVVPTFVVPTFMVGRGWQMMNIGTTYEQKLLAVEPVREARVVAHAVKARVHRKDRPIVPR
jgi:hypothetical protein